MHETEHAGFERRARERSARARSDGACRVGWIEGRTSVSMARIDSEDDGGSYPGARTTEMRKGRKTGIRKANSEPQPLLVRPGPSKRGSRPHSRSHQGQPRGKQQALRGPERRGGRLLRTCVLQLGVVTRLDPARWGAVGGAAASTWEGLAFTTACAADTWWWCWWRGAHSALSAAHCEPWRGGSLVHCRGG